MPLSYLPYLQMEDKRFEELVDKKTFTRRKIIGVKANKKLCTLRLGMELDLCLKIFHVLKRSCKTESTRQGWFRCI